MWQNKQNNESVRPDRIETTPSGVLIRRGITLVEEATEEINGVEIVVPAHYTWEEIFVSKEIWTICKKFLGYDTAFHDVYAALTELAEIITEGESNG